MPKAHKDLLVKMLRIYRGKSCCHDYTDQTTGVSSGRSRFLGYHGMAVSRWVGDELEV
jgi:hypothetical protein